MFSGGRNPKWKWVELNLGVTFLHNMSLGFLADTNVEIGFLMWPAPRHGAVGHLVVI